MLLHLLVYNLLMIAVDVAVLARLRRNSTWTAWLGGMAVAGIAAAGLAIAVGRGSLFATAHLAAYGIFGHATALFVGSAVLAWRSRPGLGWLCGLGAVGLVAVAVDAFLIEPTWLEITNYRFVSAKLDRPIRIVVLADLQTDRMGPYERRVFEEVMRQQPDLILLAGDYIHADAAASERLNGKLNQLLHEIDLQAPLGVYAIEGNIESAGWSTAFAGLPITAAWRTETFDVGPIDLTCLSETDSGYPRLSVPRPDPNRYHVVLGHRPDFALGQIEADLLLAGHTHGGQVRLPLIGPLVTLSGVPRSWAAGLVELPGGGKLIVSRGVGHERIHAPRLRFLCRPELVVLDLVPEG